jgi:hypothetical protein
VSARTSGRATAAAVAAAAAAGAWLALRRWLCERTGSRGSSSADAWPTSYALCATHRRTVRVAASQPLQRDVAGPPAELGSYLGVEGQLSGPYPAAPHFVGGSGTRAGPAVQGLAAPQPHTDRPVGPPAWGPWLASWLGSSWGVLGSNAASSSGRGGVCHGSTAAGGRGSSSFVAGRAVRVQRPSAVAPAPCRASRLEGRGGSSRAWHGSWFWAPVRLGSWWAGLEGPSGRRSTPVSVENVWAAQDKHRGKVSGGSMQGKALAGAVRDVRLGFGS